MQLSQYLILIILLLCTTSLPKIFALRFHLHDREKRCFQFKAPPFSRIIGERSVANGRGRATLHLKVETDSGQTVHDSTTADPSPTKFAFVTPDHRDHHQQEHHYDYDYDYDRDVSYTVCLQLTFDDQFHVQHAKRPVSFWIRPDHGSRHWMDVKAKEDTVSIINGALEEMQVTLHSMVAELGALQQRETHLVSRTEATASRLLLLAVLSLVVMFATATAQFFHFKTYFKSKKLI